jgi:hypothetical protein
MLVRKEVVVDHLRDFLFQDIQDMDTYFYLQSFIDLYKFFICVEYINASR